jgi:hypothetical protein
MVMVESRKSLISLEIVGFLGKANEMVREFKSHRPDHFFKCFSGTVRYFQLNNLSI